MDTAREAPVTGEYNSRDLELINEVTGPTVEHVDDNAIWWVLEEKVSEGFEKGRGIGHGASGHVYVGYVGVFGHGESVNGDGDAGMLVSSD